MTKSTSTTTRNEIGVTSKKFQESTNEQVVVELGLKLEQQNQDRSNQCKTRVVVGDDHDEDGPTYNGYNSNIISHNNNYNKNHMLYSTTTSSTSVDNNTSTITSSATPVVTYNGAVSSGGYVRGLHPFDVYSSYYSPANPFFKSSGGSGMATTTMGYAFTTAQWKELERQAMIYKYMMASLPVPPDLLYSSFPTKFSPSSTFAPASYYMGKYGSGISMRWSGNSKDAEPGRCRRTDGKKWRCSRDVAPNQKYCERHMHRGRPRSRKHVEQLQQLQQQQQQPHQNSLSNLSFNTSTPIDNSVPTAKKTRISDTSTNAQCVGSSLVQSCSKPSIFDHPLVSGGGNSNPFDDSRNLTWNEEQQWSHLVQQTNMNSAVFQNQFVGEPLNLNSHAVFNSKSDEMGLLERPLIDAWSMGAAGTKNHGHGNNVSLSLNGGNPNAIDEEMCQIHMGVGLIDSWVSTTPTPGGPLAEVLMPGNPAMSDAGDSEFVTPPATAVSSPSGVLQKTFATFSDSSGSNSPTTCNNSKASSEVPFHWLN